MTNQNPLAELAGALVLDAGLVEPGATFSVTNVMLLERSTVVAYVEVTNLSTWGSADETHHLAAFDHSGRCKVHTVL